MDSRRFTPLTVAMLIVAALFFWSCAAALRPPIAKRCADPWSYSTGAKPPPGTVIGVPPGGKTAHAGQKSRPGKSQGGVGSHGETGIPVRRGR
jgi:hypothetical protein